MEKTNIDFKTSRTIDFRGFAKKMAEQGNDEFLIGARNSTKDDVKGVPVERTREQQDESALRLLKEVYGE
jgi:hypothetical protein